VLCEKPIAATSAQAERMIAACARVGVKLMVAYRLHFEEANLSAVETLQTGKLGEPRFFSSLFSQQVMPDNSRTRGARAAGPLRDIGIYCINAARYLFREEPTEVVAFAASRIGDARFREIDEQVTALLRFPRERVAQFTCSFGASYHSSYTVVGTEGTLRLQPAYATGSELVLELEVGGKVRRRRFGKRDQIAPELDEFAACIRENREPEPSGREGLADLRVIEAIEASLKTGRPAAVSRVYPGRRPSIAQRRRAPPHRRPTLIHVRPPAER
jgi:glucose-fructose oxidoreductase